MKVLCSDSKASYCSAARAAFPEFTASKARPVLAQPETKGMALSLPRTASAADFASTWWPCSPEIRSIRGIIPAMVAYSKFGPGSAWRMASKERSKYVAPFSNSPSWYSTNALLASRRGSRGSNSNPWSANSRAVCQSPSDRAKFTALYKVPHKSRRSRSLSARIIASEVCRLAASRWPVATSADEAAQRASNSPTGSSTVLASSTARGVLSRISRHLQCHMFT